MKKRVYITLPKNISFSVFEALRLHESLFKNAEYETIYLSRNFEIKTENIVYFKNLWEIFKYLRRIKDEKVYCITVLEVILVYFSVFLGGKKQIIFWVQGLIDQEDFLSTNKKFRYLVFRILLKVSLKVSSKLVVVTNHMVKVLHEVYGSESTKSHFVIPCKSRVKYNGTQKKKNSLCYIGGLSKWQNIDKILLFFNKLSLLDPSYIFYLATFDHSNALRLIDQYVDDSCKKNIELISVKEKSEVCDFLSKMEYGFLLRDDILLNHVASPIKLAEYLSCGVNPIVSDSLKEFDKVIQHRECGIVLKDNNYNKAIEQLLLFNHSTTNALECYNDIYSDEGLVEKFKSFLNS